MLATPTVDGGIFVVALPLSDVTKTLGRLVLIEVIANPAHFDEPVTRAMTSHLVTIPADAPMTQLMDIFKRGMVAIVMHGNEFQGLITRIDLLNWLRRRQ